MADQLQEKSSISDARDPEISPAGSSTQISSKEAIDDAFPEGGARAWSVALGTAGVLFCTFGYANGFGVYQEYYISNQLRHSSPSAVSWIGSIQVFFLFAAALVGGPMFDRYGAKVIWPAALVYVFSIMMTSISKTYYQFMLSQGVLGGLGMGMTMAPSMAATPQYFNKNRGAAMGISIAGSSIGGLILPIALGKMLVNPNLSFGWTVRICGFIILAVLLPSCLAIRARLPPRKEKFLLPSAFKDIQFASIVTFAFLMILCIFTPIFFLPTYAVKYGMSNQLSSYLLAILNAASFFGRVIPGVLADRVGCLNMVAASGITSGILIFCWPKMTTNAAIIVFAALFGFCSGAIISGMAVCLSMCAKDPKDIGTYMGMGMGVVSIAALIGPPISGALVDNYHSFNQVSYFSGVVVLVGSALAIATKATTEKGIFGKI
ncbi:hypothetical protein FQN52_007326 [Onygenales sp. PD_12]|nr:hypothetical protein FQN52_007326 [Onygenales sp. PD_12]